MGKLTLRLILVIGCITVILSLKSNYCPKFKCGSSSQTVCALTTSSDNTDTAATVFIKESVCTTSQTCAYNTDNVYTTGGTISGVCVAKTTTAYVADRYPGETCTGDNQCVSMSGVLTGKCTNSKCEGVAEGGKATSTIQCVSGLYSDGTTCIKQLDKGATCNNSYECKNTYACYDSKCIDYFSLSGSDYVLSKVKDLDATYLCQYAQANEAKTACIKPDYDTTFAAKVDANGYVKCNHGETCGYTDGSKSYNFDCVCGLNEDGQGYCPLPALRCKIYYLFF